LDYYGLIANGPINIVIFGDSVSHGAVNGYYNYETVYWNRLQKKLHQVRDYMPINMINASVAGITAADSLARMEKQVMDHHPDLVIVCFGLNDVNGPLEEYTASLAQIFERCLTETEVIFMTPNMLNTCVADDTPREYWDYAHRTAEMQNSGRMDTYMAAASALAKEMGVPVCDCYAEWKKLAEKQDITMLLANRINHPTREMHELFAQALFDCIFDEEVKATAADSDMYQG